MQSFSWGESHDGGVTDPQEMAFVTPMSIASPQIAKAVRRRDADPLGPDQRQRASVKGTSELLMIKLATVIARLLPARRRRDRSALTDRFTLAFEHDGRHEATPERRRQHRRGVTADEPQLPAAGDLRWPPPPHPSMSTAPAGRPRCGPGWPRPATTRPALRTLLGARPRRRSSTPSSHPAARRRLTVADTPSAVLARLFLLGDEVSAGDAARRLGPLADELIALGLVTRPGPRCSPPSGWCRTTTC